MGVGPGLTPEKAVQCYKEPGSLQMNLNFSVESDQMMEMG